MTKPIDLGRSRRGEPEFGEPRARAGTTPAVCTRPARVLAVSLVVTVTALTAHVIAGGAVSASTTALVLAVLLMVVGPLTCRRLATSQLLGLLALAQAVVHAAGDLAAHAPLDGAMLGGHLAATLIAALVLRRGEDALTRVIERVRRFARRPIVLPVPAGLRASVGDRTPRSMVPVRLRDVVEGRGPPVVA